MWAKLVNKLAQCSPLLATYMRVLDAWNVVLKDGRTGSRPLVVTSVKPPSGMLKINA
jgi:hypothetical protein